MSARPVHQTDLDQTPLPDILVKIHRYKAPGTIECRRGNEVKEIFLDGGHITFATSNQVRDSLGDRLLNEGHITRDQYEDSVRRLVSTGKRQGTILTEMRVVSPDVMLEAVREQIQEILWSIFAWEGGTISFTPGRHKHHEFVKLDIPIPQALIEGVRHISDAKPLLARLGAKATVMARTSAPMTELILDEDELALLDAVDGTRVLFELVNLPPLAVGVNARLLYAFATLGLIAEKPDGRIKVQVRSSR
ncbi:MAG: DUF4388 domain-containing protein [Thermoanaerobaculia bacterium]